MQYRSMFLSEMDNLGSIPVRPLSTTLATFVQQNHIHAGWTCLADSHSNISGVSKSCRMLTQWLLALSMSIKRVAKIRAFVAVFGVVGVFAFSSTAVAELQSVVPEPVVNEGHSGSIVRLEWSDDAEVLLSNSDDNSARLWNTSSARLIHAVAGKTDGKEYTSLALAGDIDGKYGAVTTGNIFGLKQWRSAKAGSQSGAIKFDQPVLGLSSNETGAMLVIADNKAQNQREQIWLRANGTAGLSELDSGHFKKISASTVASREDVAAAVGTCEKQVQMPCGLLRFWSTRNGKRLKDISIDPKFAAGALGLALSPDAQLAFVRTTNELLEVNYKHGTVRTVFSEKDEIMAASTDGQKIAIVKIDELGKRHIDLRFNSEPIRSMPDRFLEPKPDGDLALIEPSCAAFSPDGKSLAIGYWDGSIAIVDTATETIKQIIAANPVSEQVSVLSRDGAFAAFWSEDLRIVDLVEGRRDKLISMPIYSGFSGVYDVGIQGDDWQFQKSLDISPDGLFVAAKVAWDGRYRIIETLRGGAVTTIPHATSDAMGAFFSSDGKRLYLRHAEDMDMDYLESFNPVTGGSLGETSGRLAQILSVSPLMSGGVAASQYSGVVSIFDAKGHETKSIPRKHNDDFVISMDASDVDDSLAIAYRSASGNRIEIHRGDTVSSIAVDDEPTIRLAANGERIYIGEEDRIRIMAVDGQLPGSSISISGPVDDLGLSEQLSRLTVVAGKALVVFDLSVNPPLEIFRVVQVRPGRFYAFDPSGRFDMDATDPDDMDVVSWSMPDDPLRPLPPELFLRDFYEPRLVSRVLDCRRREAAGTADACKDAFTDVRPLAELNRVRPAVRIVKVERGATADEALVDVMVEAVEDKSQPNNKYRSDAYDLRLFRDGQLVGQWPEGVAGGGPIEAWRSAAHITPGADGETAVRRFTVRMPVNEKTQPVKFSAYAFNEDRVKSDTTQPVSYLVPGDAPARQRRAYVVTIGINGYAAEKWRLKYAASDAKAMGDALAGLKDYKVVRLDLISPGDSGARSLATKENIRAVLGRLAGEPLSARFDNVQGAGELAPATPDDLVILSFSGHGYTDPERRFYLLPADAGSDLERDRASFISSEELGQWLRPVDAGQTVLIVDACHSAASVAQPGFKPGPMGDRGLGQLAYDKAMRILAATQVEDVAIESGALKQGLLTYALVRDGLGKDLPADLDDDGAVTLTEWLRYAETRVPAIYEEIKAGRLRATKDPENVPGTDNETRKPQTPALFDFVCISTPIVVAGSRTNTENLKTDSVGRRCSF